MPDTKIVGVRVPALRALARDLAKGRAVALDDALRFLSDAAESGVREEILVGLFLVARFRRKLEARHWSDVESWLPALDNWETCDQLASGVAVPLLGAETALRARLPVLARSEHPWTRRFAGACVAFLVEKEGWTSEEARPVLEILEGDRHPAVKKAVVWVRRALA